MRSKPFRRAFAGSLCADSSDLHVYPPLLLVRPLLEHILRHGNRREGVRPARIECNVRDNLARLVLREAVVHCPVEVIRNLRRLAAGDQGADGNQAPVARSKIGAQPEPITVLNKGRGS
jgi:hypothetical protein